MTWHREKRTIAREIVTLDLHLRRGVRGTMELVGELLYTGFNQSRRSEEL